MGNTTSVSTSTSAKLDFRNKVNTLAAKFILTQQFTDLQRLVSEQYCNNLMILTKDLLAEKFTTKEIQYLATGSKKDTIMYISKRDFEQVEKSMRNKKMLMCKGVARFYVRIAHLFAAIITTISPNWNASSGSGSNGGLPQGPLGASRASRGGSVSESETVAGTDRGRMGTTDASNDFCSIRIRALLGATRLQGDNKVAIVQPTICSVYASDTAQNQLANQPGMPDLEQLYNDVYDYETGRFSERSLGMQSKYASDLKALYTAFTGESSMPDSVKSFNDINIISLARRFPECGQTIPTPVPAPVLSGDKERKREDRDRDYYYGMGRQDPLETSNREIGRIDQAAEAKEKYIQASAKNFSGTFKSSYRVLKSSGAFSAYSSHIKTMIKNADTSRTKMFDIIDKLFLMVEMNPGAAAGSSKPTITIHPELTYEGLDVLINQARDMIIQLYVGCERDFYTGMKLLHVIVEEIMQTNMQASLAALKNTTRNAVVQITRNVPKSARDYDRYNRETTNDSVRPDQLVEFDDTRIKYAENQQREKEKAAEAEEAKEQRAAVAGAPAPVAPAPAPVAGAVAPAPVAVAPAPVAGAVAAAPVAVAPAPVAGAVAAPVAGAVAAVAAAPGGK